MSCSRSACRAPRRVESALLAGWWRATVGLLAAAVLAVGAPAQPAPVPNPLLAPPAPALVVPAIQSDAEALVQDAAAYARAFALPLDQAILQLRARAHSRAATDAVRQRFAGRLAGIAIDRTPDLRITVLLTGDEPVADESVAAGGLVVPIVFRTGARATRVELVAAIAEHQAAIRSMLHDPPGLGADPRTGELVVVITAREAGRRDLDELRDRIGQLTGMPVRIRALTKVDAELDAMGGGRIIGIDPVDARRYACTTGFVVTDGMRNAIVTAAHCPDTLVYFDRGGERIALDFAGQWGARYQDVQVNPSDRATAPLFYADTAKHFLRPVATWLNRDSLRAGDFVCHRGERTGYSCAEIELIDYAPPGNLCGGPCTPSWVTATGPDCLKGDSGGPVFGGNAAIGLVKGGSYNTDGSCNFYYFMSIDFLPPGWTLLYRH